MQKFLIIQTAFIGDVVLATVIIEKLHADFPAAEIDFLLRKGNEDLLQNHPYLKSILMWDKRQNKTKNLFCLIKLVRGKKYDKVINVQRYFSTGLLTVLSSAKEKVGFNKNPLSFLFDVKVKHIIGTKEKPIHEVQRNLSVIKHFTSYGDTDIKLYPSRDDYEKASSVVHLKASGYNNLNFHAQNVPVATSKYICIAPCSVWFTKQYPKEKWIEFIKHLNQQMDIFLIGAVSDKLVCEEIKTALPGYLIHNLCGSFTYLQSAALMKNAVMNYVNDSAPAHIASAMNAPVTVIFCSTVTWFGYAPVNENSFVVEKEEPLYCRPCSIHGKHECPEKHFKCALDIKSRQLLSTLEMHNYSLKQEAEKI